MNWLKFFSKKPKESKEDLMKKFNANDDLSDDEDPSSYMKLGSKKFENTGLAVNQTDKSQPN